MKQTTKRFFSTIVGLALLVGSFVVYFDFISPAYDELKALKSEVAGRKKFIATKQADIEKIKNLAGSYEAQGKLQDTASLVLPPDEDVAGGLAQLYGIAKANGLVLQYVDVAVGGLRNAQKTEVGMAGANQIQKPIGSVLYRLRLTGTYDNFKSFVKMLETNMRIFDLENLSLQSAGEGKQSFYTLGVSVSGYYQKQ